jgi:hypothetical protein
MSPPIASWLLSATSGAHRGTSPLKPAPRCSALVERRSLPPHRSPRLFEAGDRSLDPTSSFFLDEWSSSGFKLRLSSMRLPPPGRNAGPARARTAAGNPDPFKHDFTTTIRRIHFGVYLWEFHRLFSVRLFFNEIMRMRARRFSSDPRRRDGRQCYEVPERPSQPLSVSLGTHRH